MKHALFAAFAATFAAPAFAGDMSVTLPFAAEIGGKPFTCAETFSGLGSSGADVAASDFRMFVSNAALVRADGSLQPIALDQDGQ